ncbi:MAG TPA: AIR synthase-related protein, partial [Thermoanaerobaculia bacterium]|nr:AIR synthase-related protein [Thermoanaerobaculia bacterium]
AAYRDPEPRVALGLELSRRNLWNGAIDVSDGIGVDAARLARASGLRAVIEKERLPVSPALETLASLQKKDPFDWILGGGDDYELLFAAPVSALAGIGRLASREVPITRIGRLEKGKGTVVSDRDRERDIASVGHDHFERRT